MVTADVMASSDDCTLREMTCEQMILSRPDGSVSFNCGETTVVAAVYGPADVQMRRELVDRASVDLTFCPSAGLPGCRDREMELRLRTTCESVLMATLHPRTAVRIVVQEVCGAGSLLAASLNATCLTLLDAAVPLCHLFAAITFVITATDCLIVDPTLEEETSSRAHFVVVFDSEVLGVLACRCEGQFSDAEYRRGVAVCREASRAVFAFYRQAMRRKLIAAVL